MATTAPPWNACSGVVGGMGWVSYPLLRGVSGENNPWEGVSQLCIPKVDVSDGGSWLVGHFLNTGPLLEGVCGYQGGVWEERSGSLRGSDGSTPLKWAAGGGVGGYQWCQVGLRGCVKGRRESVWWVLRRISVCQTDSRLQNT